jgi:acetyltransferase-like isoleucine patch superfamily enzyme
MSVNLQVQSAGRNVTLSSGCELYGSERMAFGNDVFVGAGGTLAIVYQRAEPGPMIAIGDGVWMNKRCYLQAANSVVVGAKAIFAPDVYLADSAYDYRDVGVPIMSQGLQSTTNRIEIGAGAWLGIRVAVLGNVRVGAGSVVGANAVVTHDVPDYCVAVGQPARVVRAYDARANDWVRVGSDAQLADILQNGRNSLPPPHEAKPHLAMFYAPKVTIP